MRCVDLVHTISKLTTRHNPARNRIITRSIDNLFNQLSGSIAFNDPMFDLLWSHLVTPQLNSSVYLTSKLQPCLYRCHYNYFCNSVSVTDTFVINQSVP